VETEKPVRPRHGLVASPWQAANRLVDRLPHHHGALWSRLIQAFRCVRTGRVLPNRASALDRLGADGNGSDLHPCWGGLSRDFAVSPGPGRRGVRPRRL
jgi:hypothetical protein